MAALPSALASSIVRGKEHNNNALKAMPSFVNSLPYPHLELLLQDAGQCVIDIRRHASRFMLAM